MSYIVKKKNYIINKNKKQPLRLKNKLKQISLERNIIYEILFPQTLSPNFIKPLELPIYRNFKG